MNRLVQYNRRYGRNLIMIAFPIMISNLITQLQMIIDKIYLGRLDISCMSAVGNATSPIWTTLSFCFTISTGATILMSQATGAGNRERAKAIAASMLKCNNYLSIALFLFWLLFSEPVFRLMGVDESIMSMAVSYARIYSPVFILIGIGASIMSILQVNEKTQIMIAYGLVRSIANIILDYVMIFGKFGCPALGVSGAALATTIAEYLGDAVILVYFLRSKELWLRPSVKEILKAKAGLFFSSIKLGLPAACEEFAWSIGNLYMIVMLNRISVEAAGIYTIVFSVECIPVVVFGALGNATLTLSGRETGAEHVKGVSEIVLTSLSYCTLMAVINLAAFLAIPKAILTLFTSDASIIAMSAGFLLIVGINMFPKMGNMIVGSGIRGFGDTRWMLFTQCIGTVFIIIVASVLVIGLKLGMVCLFWLVVADETLRCVINSVKLRSIDKAAVVRRS